MSNEQNLPIVNVDLAPLYDTAKFATEKIEKYTGLVFTQEIAVNTLIERIKEMKLPPLEEAAFIANANKIITEYSKQNNVVQCAINFLQKNNLNVSQETTEDTEEWYSRFFDQVKHVSKEDMQQLWGRILANELSSPGSVTKQLLHVMSIIEREQAMAFSKLCSCSVKIEDEIVLLYEDIDAENQNIWKEVGINLVNIIELEALGLISINPKRYIFELEKPCIELKVATYNNKEIKLVSDQGEIKELNCGNAALTKTGLALYNSIEHFYGATDLSFYIEFFEKQGFQVEKI